MSHEPIFLVRALNDGGAAYRVDLSDQVLGWSYEDNDTKADALTLTVDNADLSNFDDPVWVKGRLLEVTWGYPGKMTPPRTVQIHSVQGFRELEIEAYGKELAFATTVKSRTFRTSKRSDVVRTLAQEQGYGEDELHIDDTSVVHDTIVQARLTDAQFIKRLAHKEGFVWYVDFDGFHFHKRDFTQRPMRVYRYFNDPDESEISNVQIDNDVTAKPGRVKTKGRDPLNREDVGGDASNETEASRGALSETLEIIDPDTGATLGFRTTQQEDTRLTPEETNEGAQREAAGQFRRAQQVAVKLSFDAMGDPYQLAKTVIVIENIGKRLSQKYYVQKVVHRDNYVMTVTCVSDGHGGHSTESVRAEGVSLLQVARVQGKRGPNLNANDIATLLEHAQGVLESKGLDPGPLTAQKVGDKVIFKDTKGRNVPVADAAEVTKQIAQAAAAAGRLKEEELEQFKQSQAQN